MRLRALTIETPSHNVIVKAVRPDLLLVLDGAAGARDGVKITAEHGDDEAYGLQEGAEGQVLRAQRLKADELAEYILQQTQGLSFLDYNTHYSRRG